MRAVDCDSCGSADAELWAERPPRADVLHRRFVRCRSCGFVYADPRAEPDEAAAHYRGAYNPMHSIVDTDAAWEQRVQGRATHLRLAGATGGGTFLDAGFGDGSSLEAARRLGYRPVGLELTPSLVEQARAQVPDAMLELGDLSTTQIVAPDSVDLFYSWHAIEHVLDVNVWLADVHRVLRPGGRAVIGTESADAVEGHLRRLPFLLLRRVPWPPTSTDHTYWFSPAILRRLAEAADFRVVETRVYENRPAEVYRSAVRGVAGRRAKLIGLIQVVAATLSLARPSFGGKQIIILDRP